MKEKKLKIFIGGTENVILAIICFSFLLLIAITFFILGIFFDALFIVGYILLGLFAFIVLCVLIALCFHPAYIELNGDGLTYKNFYGKIKAKHSWVELKSIELRTIPILVFTGLIFGYRKAHLQNYFLFNFSDNQIENPIIPSIYKDNDAMILMYTKKHEELLRQFTSVQIIDNRDIEDTTWEFFRH